MGRHDKVYFITVYFITVYFITVLDFTRTVLLVFKE